VGFIMPGPVVVGFIMPGPVVVGFIMPGPVVVGFIMPGPLDEGLSEPVLGEPIISSYKSCNSAIVLDAIFEGRGIFL
jgi:hypothetical protein